MRFEELIYLLKSDLYRHTGRLSKMLLLRHLILVPEFKCSFWMRVSAYLAQHNLCKYTLYHISRVLYAHYRIRYGVDIPYTAKIGGGFHIVHIGGIVIHPNAVIGKNCSVSQGVTIGYAYRGERRGCPLIGDNVYIGPGAKVIGNIEIGNNVAIGANCVVTKDVPHNAVVAGVPGKVISYAGSAGYVVNILNLE